MAYMEHNKQIHVAVHVDLKSKFTVYRNRDRVKKHLFLEILRESQRTIRVKLPSTKCNSHITIKHIY